MKLNKANLLGFNNEAERLKPMIGSKPSLEETQNSTEEDLNMPTEEDVIGEPQPEIGPSPSTQQDIEMVDFS